MKRQVAKSRFEMVKSRISPFQAPVKFYKVRFFILVFQIVTRIIIHSLTKSFYLRKTIFLEKKRI